MGIGGQAGDKGRALGKKGVSGRVWDEPVDYGRVAEKYHRYSKGFPAGFFEHLKKLVGDLNVLPSGGKVRIIELGTGTGMVALGIAEQLGRGVAVMGVDISEKMLQVARKEGIQRGMDVRFALANAENTLYADDAFHIVLAARSWRWFNQAAAMREVKRLLRPGGFFMIANYGASYGGCF